MTHAQKLRIMATTLTAIIFAIVLWIVVQLAMGVNAQAAREDAERQCSPISKTFEAQARCMKDVMEGAR